MQYEVSGYVQGGGSASLQITEQRFKEVRDAKDACLSALEVEEKLALLLDNFFEFEVELLKLAEQFLLWRDTTHRGMMQDRLLLDRRLVNLLTACRLYLDQVDHVVSGIFGSPSAELEQLKAFKNELYDSSLGYRIMEALRNHVQHAGLLVHIISYDNSKVEGQGHDDWQVVVSPISLVETLSENRKFKKETLTEIKALGPKLDLRWCTRDYLSCFSRLHERARGIIHTRFGPARGVYEQAVAEYSTVDQVPIQLPRLFELNEDTSANQEIALVTEFLKLHDVLREKNKERDYRRSFASNRSVV